MDQSSRHRAALDTACLVVIALLLTVPFQTERVSNVVNRIGLARR